MNLKKRLNRKGREGDKGSQKHKQWLARIQRMVAKSPQAFSFPLRSFVPFALKNGF